MKEVIFLLLGLIVFGLPYYGGRFFFLLHVSKQLIEEAMPFKKDDGEGFSILVLGDSTAVGVGAERAEESVPGRVAAILQATYVENHSVSGAMVRDLPEQIKRIERSSYDLVLVQIGANDITRFHSPRETADELSSILETLPTAKQTIVITAGDVGDATIFPPFVRPLFTRETVAYHAAFESTLNKKDRTYVNLNEVPRNYLFKTEPSIYFAADGFHPSSAGYGIWFEAVEAALKR